MNRLPKIFGTFLLFVVSGVAHAQENDAEGPQSQIEQAVKNYVSAFNKHDATGLAATWSTTGIYTSKTSGIELKGRDNLQKAFAEYFKENDTAKLAVTTESIEFVSPNVAIETGQAVVTNGDQPKDATNYSAVYVKTGDAWLIDRLSEEGIPKPKPSHHEHLKELEWLVGEWVDQDEGFVIDTTCSWTKNQNHLFRVFKVTTPEGVAMSGIEIIGWDPAEKKIRSWVFDSDGSFVKAEWKPTSNGWTKSNRATFTDGKKGSSLTVLEKTEDGNIKWQQVNRVADGEILPSIDPIIVVRKSAE